MDSGDSERMRELLSPLIEVLRLLAQSQPAGPSGEMFSTMLDRLETAQIYADDPDLFRQFWPEVEMDLSWFLDILTHAGSDLSAPYSVPTALDKDALRVTIENVVAVGNALRPVGDDSTAHFGPARAKAAESQEEWESAAAAAAESYEESYEEPSFEAPAAFVTSLTRDIEAPAPRSAPVESTPEEPSPSNRVVNTGFSDRGQPETVMDADQPLKLNTAYWFWFEIGPLQQGSIEDSPAPLPNFLPADAQLTIAVFSFPGELILSDDADLGTMRLTGGVASEVIDQPGIFESLFRDITIRKSRLFFPVKTPLASGRYRMRCNIYYEHILLESRIVAAHVGQLPQNERTLRSTVDYKISHTLDPARLSRMAPQTLSIFVNDNPNDTHGFYFEGEQLKTQSLPDGQQLQDSLTQTRKALRRVAWGSSDPWQPSFAYRYSSPGESSFFAGDLIALAIRGYMVYSALIDKISGGVEASDKLATTMLKPGRVQIGSKESARMVVPAAMFYDRPLDTQLPKHSVCDAFLSAVRAQEDLEDSPCFRGECPHLNELDVVCPSGFWGYRHELGLPVSIEQASTGDVETEIQFNDPASMVVIVSMDQMFKERETHETQLKLIRTPLGLTLCETRSTALTALQQQQAQLVYFYCHGGLTLDNTPFLSIGNNEALTPDNIRAYRIRWKVPRPLVFMNGCMTAALEPEKAIDFVSAFVNQAGASGVIGTEITVFEPLATQFAQAFLKCFMGQCKSIGESVKLARLALLKQFNPLGLVYIPFALPGLHLVDLATAKSATTSGQPQASA